MPSMLAMDIAFSAHFFEVAAYSFIPVKSTATNGSSPTTHASCPGGTYATSPGPNSCSVPSSILTRILPDIPYCVCANWQLFVLAMGLTSLDHFQPGSKVTL